MKKILLAFAISVLFAPLVRAQIAEVENEEKFDTDSIIRDFDNRPFFGIYKDNYFVGGTSIGSKPTSHNSDVKFQVSISQRLTRSTLPFNTYAFLFYSQKCMWNVFEKSLPMRDFNFNPGLGISKLLVSKNRLVGKVTLMIEHESNGRDKMYDRSWNKLSLAGNIYLTPHIMIHGKYWLTYIDSKQNKDILRYSGIYQTGIQIMSNDRKWVFSTTLVKRKGWNLNYNTIVDVGYRIRKKDNQFLMLHYYNGYGENLLDYNKFHSRLRIGLLIKPRFFSDF
ncbi:MAG: phospholipase A [Bacteroidales bacterium]|nr:phospholipase A [Bacteroidales bacterium]